MRSFKKGINFWSWTVTLSREYKEDENENIFKIGEKAASEEIKKFYRST